MIRLALQVTNIFTLEEVKIQQSHIKEHVVVLTKATGKTNQNNNVYNTE